MIKLKILSMLGFVVYPLLIVFSAFAPDGGERMSHPLALVSTALFYTYALFHFIAGWRDAPKTEAVRISSAIARIVVGMMLVIALSGVVGFWLGTTESNLVHSGFVGGLIICLPFLIVASIMILKSSNVCGRETSGNLCV